MRRSLQSTTNILGDWWFDRRHGTDTMSRLQQDEIEVDSPHKASAHAYIPTRGRPFRAVLRSLDFPADSVFVDYGSGKGKLLMLATEFRFKRIVGIEYAPELHRIALANIKRLAQPVAARIQPVCADATAYQLADDENVFYFYNPFERDVLELVVERIRESIDRNPRHIWVIYVDPRFSDAFADRLGLEQTRTFTHGGFDVVVLEGGTPAPGGATA
ncbi:class I SAM-dependent methyltransferase [Blastococcus sp. URHD0036]|uniref:class I SAM-dependent methyltransferase n=1 Tax=Blastococcus sp. URHD0036 TaxID=1380356 RepID=UPI00068B3FC5|nr:class I SAM-dependent methyltransferase [Blastococcus sp. URHD0036]